MPSVLPVTFDMPTRFDDFIDLSPLLKLTKICLRLAHTYVTPAAIARAIGSVASDVVADLELTFVDLGKSYQWGPVDDAIIALASRCSQPFRVTINGVLQTFSRNPLEMEGKVLPNVNSRGLLQVRHPNSIHVYG
jgi:hypothetical protein